MGALTITNFYPPSAVFPVSPLRTPSVAEWNTRDLTLPQAQFVKRGSLTCDLYAVPTLAINTAKTSVLLTNVDLTVWGVLLSGTGSWDFTTEMPTGTYTLQIAATGVLTARVTALTSELSVGTVAWTVTDGVGELSAVHGLFSAPAQVFAPGTNVGEGGTGGGTVLVLRGAWTPGTAYTGTEAQRDIITYLGSSYLCLQTHTSEDLTAPVVGGNAYWQLLAQRGGDGAAATGFVPLGAWVTGTTYSPMQCVVGSDGSGYVCTVEHTSDSDTRPSSGADWATVWQKYVNVGATGVGAAGADGKGWRDRGAWSVAAASYVNSSTFLDTVLHNNVLYKCVQSHTSDSTTEPGVGVSWAAYWAIVLSAPLSSDIGTWRDTWGPSNDYLLGDIVYWIGGSFRCILAHTSTNDNQPPDDTYWFPVALRGLPGAPGAAGAAATITFKGAWSSSMGALVGTASAIDVVSHSVPRTGTLYRVTASHTAAADKEPGVSTGWENYFALMLEPPAPVALGDDKGVWALTTQYYTHDIVRTSTGVYWCLQDHVSASTSEPGVGATWTAYWVPLTYLGSDGRTPVYQGDWSSATIDYMTPDIVRNNGASYGCKQNHSSSAGTEPGTEGGADYWQLVAADGTGGGGSGSSFLYMETASLDDPENPTSLTIAGSSAIPWSTTSNNPLDGASVVLHLLDDITIGVGGISLTISGHGYTTTIRNLKHGDTLSAGVYLFSFDVQYVDYPWVGPAWALVGQHTLSSDYIAAIVAALLADEDFITAIITAMTTDEDFMTAFVTALSNSTAFLEALTTVLAGSTEFITALSTALATNETFLNSLVEALSTNETFLSALITALTESSTFLSALVDALVNNSTFLSALVDLLVENETFIAIFGKLRYGVTTGDGEDYAVTVSPVVAEWEVGMPLLVQFNAANTGAATLAVGELDAVSLHKQGTSELEAGDIVENAIYLLVYDGTALQVVSGFGSGSGGGGDLDWSRGDCIDGGTWGE